VVIDRPLSLVLGIVVGVLLSGLGVEGQQAKDHRIGILNPGLRSASGEGSLAELRQLGYVEGQNLVVERPYAAGHGEQLPAMAEDLVRLKVDVIVATGGDAIRAARHVTTTIRW
jgi:putative tryptophan/tyrosine transport system substrate-binding protein